MESKMTETFTGTLGEHGKTAEESLSNLRKILPHEEGNSKYQSLDISVNKSGENYLAVAKYSLKGKEKPVAQSTGTGALESELEKIAFQREKDI